MIGFKRPIKRKITCNDKDQQILFSRWGLWYISVCNRQSLMNTQCICTSKSCGTDSTVNEDFIYPLQHMFKCLLYPDFLLPSFCIRSGRNCPFIQQKYHFFFYQTKADLYKIWHNSFPQNPKTAWEILQLHCFQKHFSSPTPRYHFQKIYKSLVITLKPMVYSKLF